LELLDKYAFSREYGGRDGVPKIAIVITDGTSRQPSRTRQLAFKAHNQGIIMFSIGIYCYTYAHTHLSEILTCLC